MSFIVMHRINETCKKAALRSNRRTHMKHNDVPVLLKVCTAEITGCMIKAKVIAKTMDAANCLLSLAECTVEYR